MDHPRVPLPCSLHPPGCLSSWRSAPVIWTARVAVVVEAFRLQLPATLTTDDVIRWLSAVGAHTQPPRGGLLGPPPVDAGSGSQPRTALRITSLPATGSARCCSPPSGRRCRARGWTKHLATSTSGLDSEQQLS